MDGIDLVKLRVRLDAGIEDAHEHALARAGNSAPSDRARRRPKAGQSSEDLRIDFDGRQGTLDPVGIAGAGAVLPEVGQEQGPLRDTHREELVDLPERWHSGHSERFQIGQIVVPIGEVDDPLALYSRIRKV